MKKIILFFLILISVFLCACGNSNSPKTEKIPEKEALLCCGVDIEKYTIVIPENADVNEENLGNLLRYHLYTKFGCELKVMDDSAEYPYEILIGSAHGHTESITEGEFSVRVYGKKLCLYACDLRGFEALYDYIKNELLYKKHNTLPHIPEDLSILKSAENSIDDGTAFFEKSFGDVRVMYYNVYSGSNNNATPRVRQPFQKEIIEAYLPKVLGFQEYAAKYHSDFTPMLESLGYTEITTSRGNNNCTPIFYRSDSLELIDSGHYLYKDTNDYSKSISWAVFKLRNTGNTFAFFNTHFMFRRDGVDADAVRVSNASEALSVFLELQTKYPDIPMILGGDFNCKPNSSPHNVLTDAGLVSAHSCAEVKNNSKGHHPHATYDPENKVFSYWNKITTLY